MTEAVDINLQAALAQVLGERDVTIATQQRATGGCINRATRIILTDGRRFFAKGSDDGDQMFGAELAGLEHLVARSPLRTPQVVGIAAKNTNSLGSEAVLFLEDIQCGQPTPAAWHLLGSMLAEQHRSSERAFGFASDNFIGSTPQPNDWCTDWPAFFRKQRLEYQLELARRNSAPAQLLQLGEQLCETAESLLRTDEPPALLHGDLWNGNVLFDTDGLPVIIDPAVYYGHREAELALPQLFGGFPKRFWDGYQVAWPLPSGWQKRLEIYKLYHLLNHLNLFGGAYVDQCSQSLRRILCS